MLLTLHTPEATLAAVTTNTYKKVAINGRHIPPDSRAKHLQFKVTKVCRHSKMAPSVQKEESMQMSRQSGPTNSMTVTKLITKVAPVKRSSEFLISKALCSFLALPTTPQLLQQ